MTVPRSAVQRPEVVAAATLAVDARWPAASVWLWRLSTFLLSMAALTALACAWDGRQPGYSSVWSKPLKFQLALAVHAATLAWALPCLAPTLRRVAMPPVLLALWSGVALYEAFYITLQGARGVASHFNRATPWESVAASLMAAGAGVLVSVTFWVGAVALWQVVRGGDSVGEREASPSGRGGSGQASFARLLQPDFPLAPLAIGLGFTLGAVLAAWSGSAMGAARGYWPQPLQEPVFWMPLTGWVLSQTDLRLAHFIGLHQMQLLPVLAAAAAWAGWRPGATRFALGIASVAAVIAVGWLQRP